MYNFLFWGRGLFGKLKKNKQMFHHGSFHHGMSTRTHHRSSLSLPTPTTSAPTIAKPGGMAWDPLEGPSSTSHLGHFGTNKNKNKRQHPGL